MPILNFAAHRDDESIPHQENVPHGTLCDCSLLAAALGLGPEVVSFDYCRNVLQHRWSMTCKHGEVRDTSRATRTGERWKDKGEMNPVLAILVKNA